MTRANIGTRHWNEGWFHIDVDPTPLVGPDGRSHPVDLVCDAAKIPLPDDSFDHVFSSEAIEHFPWRRTGAVVQEWARLLRPGGSMRIETPDLCAAAGQLLSEESLQLHLAMQQIFFAEQSGPHDIHLAGLTHLTLPYYFERAGLVVVNVERGWECGWLRVDGVK
jgi:ubiquinone/menaquinone biosynthesis C-methylase UbiE